MAVPCKLYISSLRAAVASSNPTLLCDSQLFLKVHFFFVVAEPSRHVFFPLSVAARRRCYIRVVPYRTHSLYFDIVFPSGRLLFLHSHPPFRKATRDEHVTQSPFSLVFLLTSPLLRLDSVLFTAPLLDHRCPLLFSSPSTPITSVPFPFPR